MQSLPFRQEVISITLVLVTYNIKPKLSVSLSLVLENNNEHAVLLSLEGNLNTYVPLGPSRRHVRRGVRSPSFTCSTRVFAVFKMWACESPQSSIPFNLSQSYIRRAFLIIQVITNLNLSTQVYILEAAETIINCREFIPAHFQRVYGCTKCRLHFIQCLYEVLHCYFDVIFIQWLWKVRQVHFPGNSK